MHIIKVAIINKITDRASYSLCLKHVRYISFKRCILKIFLVSGSLFVVIFSIVSSLIVLVVFLKAFRLSGITNIIINIANNIQKADMENIKDDDEMPLYK